MDWPHEHLPFEKQTAVIAALVDGNSIRATERLVGVHRDSAMRLGARVGQGCAALHDLMFRDLNVSQLQFDELWAYIGKKQKRLKKTDDAEKGDSYTFLALDALNKAIVSYKVGKRTGETTLDFVQDVRARVLGTPMISSDAFAPYESTIRYVFGDNVLYGQIVKTYAHELHKDAARRYSPSAVVGVKKHRIIGFMPAFLTTTSHVERTNLSVRMGSRRFTRLSEWLQQKAGASRSGRCLVRGALQSLPCSRDLAHDARYGDGPYRSAVVNCRANSGSLGDARKCKPS